MSLDHATHRKLPLSTEGHAQTDSNQQSQSIQRRSRASSGLAQFASHLDPESAGGLRSQCLRGPLQQNPRLTQLLSLILHDHRTNTIVRMRCFSLFGFHFLRPRARAFSAVRVRPSVCGSVTLHSTARFSRDWPIRSSSSHYIPATLNRPIIKPPFALLATSLPQ